MTASDQADSRRLALHGVLLAAGSASRYGSAKQLLPIDGVPMVRRAALAALQVGARLLVVTGAHAVAVEAALVGLPLELLHNPDWEQGMGGSIGCAFRHIGLSSSASLLLLADQPQVGGHLARCRPGQVGAGELQRLVDAGQRMPGRIVAANHGTLLGPPCLFPQRWYPELAALSGPQGARGLLQKHAAEVESLPLPEAAADIDTPEDYRRLLQNLSRQA